MSRAEHFAAGTASDDKYQGESDAQYRKRKQHEAALAAHAAKHPVRDPFAGIPGADDER